MTAPLLILAGIILLAVGILIGFVGAVAVEDEEGLTDEQLAVVDPDLGGDPMQREA